jgi:hypothetical protein
VAGTAPRSVDFTGAPPPAPAGQLVKGEPEKLYRRWKP